MRAVTRYKYSWYLIINFMYLDKGNTFEHTGFQIYILNHANNYLHTSILT